MESKPESRPRGRPREMRADAAALAAAFALLVERGYAGVSFDAVAARAGISKATLYRRWDSRAALATDAFFETTFADLEFPGAPRAADDFRGQIKRLAELLRSNAGRAFAALIAGAGSDPAIGPVIASRWVAARQRSGLARFAAARAAGEVQPDTDTDAALLLLYGPLYARLLLGAGVPDDAAIDAYLDLVVRSVFLPA